MFPELNNILKLSPDTSGKGEFILISEREADASFLIHHFLSLFVRAGRKVCFLAVAQSFSHYSSVSQRLGVSLSQARERGQLVFLEGLKECCEELLLPSDSLRGRGRPLRFLSSLQSDLRGLFEFVQQSVGVAAGGAEHEDWGTPVLIVDDVSLLLSLGVQAGAVQDFCHYCKTTVCSQLQGNVVMLVHVEEEDDSGEEGSEFLLKALTHQCSLALKVQGLPTGYCREIHVGGMAEKDRKHCFQFPASEEALPIQGP